MQDGMKDLYLWKNPVATAPVFGMVFVVLMSLCYYSLLSVVAYTALFVLGTSAGIRAYVYVMNTFLKKNVNDPLASYAGKKLDKGLPGLRIDLHLSWTQDKYIRLKIDVRYALEVSSNR